MPLNRKSFRFNLLVVLLLCVGLYILVFLSLGWITKHGDEGPVPNAVGRDFRLVKAEIERAGFEIEVDSSYDPTKKPLVVLSQQPDVGSVVKRGRTLFLTLNKTQPPPTAMPNLVSLSFRSAALILKSNHLVLGDTTYRPTLPKVRCLSNAGMAASLRLALCYHRVAAWTL
jgi:beta-lactam-binding protein with PASTA domain